MSLATLHIFLATLSLPTTGEKGIPPIALIFLIGAIVLAAVLVILRLRQNKQLRDKETTDAVAKKDNNNPTDNE